MSNPTQFDIEARELLEQYFKMRTRVPEESNLFTRQALTQLHDLHIQIELDNLYEMRGLSIHLPVKIVEEIDERIATLKSQLTKKGK